MLRPSILFLSLACLAANVGCGSDPAPTPADAATDTAPADVAADTSAPDVAPADVAVDTATPDVTPADATPADVTPVADAAPADATPADAAVDAAPADAAPAFVAHAPCNAASDYMTGTAVAFGGAVGNNYSPRCIRVRAGATVTFNGSFGGHPLAPGMGGSASSPIPMQSSGSSTPVTFPAAGYYPYFCTFHGTATGAGMAGVVWVEP